MPRSTPPRTEPARARTLPQLLRARAAATPLAEALRFGDTSLGCAELLAAAEALASRLRDEGVGPGDRVAVMLPNGIEFPVAWLAVPMVRAIVVPVNVAYRGRDLEHVLTHSGASVVIAGPGQREAVEPALAATPHARRVIEIGEGWARSADAALDGDYAEPGESEESVDLDDPVDADEPVTIQYTSGTTGFPKGCVLHHGYWLRLARTIRDFTGLGPDDVLLTAQPQSYMDPSWNLVLAMLVGAPLVVLPRFSASTFWHDVGRHRATFFYCIGTMPVYLLRQPEDPGLDRGHGVRLVYCSGIPASLHVEFERRWGCPWRETYGTTELGVVLAAMPDDEASVGSGSMGGPVPGREVRVVDEEGRDLPPGTPGELLVRGPDTMLGYHEDPAATETWRPDGWARTGDLVVDTGTGFAHLGRTRDMIRRAGENIAAAEVEAALVEHPGVRAAACIAVPDDLRGEEVKAYVQRTHGATVAEAAIRDFVAARLARFKVPRYIEFVEALPLTQSEKIAKGELVASREDHRVGAWDAEGHG